MVPPLWPARLEGRRQPGSASRTGTEAPGRHTPGSPAPAGLDGRAEQQSSPEANQRQAQGPPLDVLISSVSPEPFIKLQRKETSISSHLPPTRVGKLLTNQTRPGCRRGAATGTSLRVFCVPSTHHSGGRVPAACWQGGCRDGAVPTQRRAAHYGWELMNIEHVGRLFIFYVPQTPAHSEKPPGLSIFLISPLIHYLLL